MKKNKNAFTLVELIVVIIILAILWTIAFISLQWYSMEARDSKRVSDVRSLLTKINIESAKWVDYSKMILPSSWSTLQVNSIRINWEDRTSNQWIVNFEFLKEDSKSFKDPSNQYQDYPMAYAQWAVWSWTTRIPYKFVEMATISEKEWQAVIMWNYYKLNPSDSPSLFINPDNLAVENGNNILPYNPWITPWQSWGSSSWWEAPEWTPYCVFDWTWNAWKFDSCKFQ